MRLSYLLPMCVLLSLFAGERGDAGAQPLHAAALELAPAIVAPAEGQDGVRAPQVRGVEPGRDGARRAHGHGLYRPPQVVDRVERVDVTRPDCRRWTTRG